MMSRAVALCLFAVVTIAGCGGSEPDAEPREPSNSSAPEVEPADGERVSTVEYSFNAPDDWKSRDDVPGFEFDSLALDTNDKDGFADNVNVIRVDPAPPVDFDQFEEGSVKELKAAKFGDIKISDRVDIDGEPAFRVTSTGSQNGNVYDLNQYGTVHGGVAYIVTFSHSPDLSEKRKTELASSVLASWQWVS